MVLPHRMDNDYVAIYIICGNIIISYPCHSVDSVVLPYHSMRVAMAMFYSVYNDSVATYDGALYCSYGNALLCIPYWYMDFGQ